jgi:protein involved in temperature-dependent protein secretion
MTKEPIQTLLQKMRELDHEGKHEEANRLREEIMERLRASVGRGFS